MKTQLGSKLGRTIALTLCLLSSTAAMADDAVLGALLGGGAGAVVGRSVGGRDGTIIGGALGAAAGAVIGSQRGHTRVVEYSAPPVVHYAPPVYQQQVYYAPPVYRQQVYYSQPVRYEQRPVYFVQDGYDRGYRRHYRDRDDYRHDHHRRDWKDRH